MDLQGFALIGSQGNHSHAASYQAFLRAVKQFSNDSCPSSTTTRKRAA